MMFLLCLFKGRFTGNFMEFKYDWHFIPDEIVLPILAAAHSKQPERIKLQSIRKDGIQSLKRSSSMWTLRSESWPLKNADAISRQQFWIINSKDYLTSFKVSKIPCQSINIRAAKTLAKTETFTSSSKSNISKCNVHFCFKNMSY